MIFVDGHQLSSTDPQKQRQGISDALEALMEHPALLSSAEALKGKQEMKFSSLQTHSNHCHDRLVYVFQREFATVDPSLADLVGTDEATTCLGLIIRNRRTGMTSVAHLDSPKIVDIGISQMLSLVVDRNCEADLDVHVLGGFDDISDKVWLKNPYFVVDIPENHQRAHTEVDIFTFVCSKLMPPLGLKGALNWMAILCLCFETSTGTLVPACFDDSTRCPDEIVRRIRVVASNEDSTWDGKLLGTYDTRTDCFVVAPCSWTLWQVHVALTLRHRSNEEILLECSTSPSAEAPDFVDNLRRYT
ncbi:hypothetical protein Tsubulata_037235 [Turnera subulata]|uniref:Protein N-terminal asparagine amidohydrolase n=1 Tax=Turnera subulata TaxID=218843 RepID=A0A9Q0GFQ3_9ROSI|nr:hypothetical protein Tsubulata_037235 [Turnera subulata]